MNFFKNMIKSIKDQIKWGNRKPRDPVKQKTIEIKKVEPIVKPKEKTNNSFKCGRQQGHQKKRKILRKISRASRRANIREGRQGVRT